MDARLVGLERQRVYLHEGYWGPQVGFYGGISYGFGYFGHGFEGGRWDHDHFFYNRSVTNVNVTVIHNVYNTTVVNRTDVRVSYNGGNGGINERPTREQESYDHERHVPPVAEQTRHVEAARGNTQLRASYNHGKPPVAATPRPGAFNEHGVVAAKEGSYKAEASRPAPHAGTAAGGRTETNARPETNAGGHSAVHPNELPAAEKHAPPNTGNAKQDQKYQQQQDKLDKQQAQERQKLQAQQEKEHQQFAKQNADEARKAQVEQKHQQQTQQMVQRHTQQQNLQQKQQPHAAPAPKQKH